MRSASPHIIYFSLACLDSPPLDALQSFNIPLELGISEINTVFSVASQLVSIGHKNCPQSAGLATPDTILPLNLPKVPYFIKCYMYVYIYTHLCSTVQYDIKERLLPFFKCGFSAFSGSPEVFLWDFFQQAFDSTNTLLNTFLLHPLLLMFTVLKTSSAFAFPALLMQKQMSLS